MPENADATPAVDQAAYWNGDAGRKWVALQDQIDAMLAAVTTLVLDHAGAPVGARVLDIGCGCGTTVLALAQRVGAAGHVQGVDISRPMLDVAERRATAAGLRNVTLHHADAAAYEFPPAARDVAFSRFGVMFFDQPETAFANIRRALSPAAKLAFVCWRPLRESPAYAIPAQAVAAIVPPAPPPDPEAPGQFAFADPDRVRRILTSAGFSGIDITPHDPPMRLGDLDRAVSFALQMGPASRALADASEAQRHATAAALRAAFAPHAGPDGIVLTAGVWMVTARA